MNAVNLIDLHDVEVRRAGRTILRVDNLSLAEGESMALLGPNGAGKSTFIQLITREIFPLHKEKPPVCFRGDAHASLEDVRQAIGIVSATMQDQMTVHLTAREVVAGGLFGSLGVPRRFTVRPAQGARIREVMEELGIANLADRDITTLSSGQARRVLIARALVHKPGLLILDEPCTGLDAEGMYYVRQAMRTIAQSGRALMLVTHHPEDIVPEINRILLIKEGIVYADGSKTELLTSETMSKLFNVPLRIYEKDGRYMLM